METKIYYEADADERLLEGRTIAIIGYGAQGAAHAQNVRDSGCDVIVGQRVGGPGYQAAVQDGFQPVAIAEAAARADLINILLPDEVHGEVFEKDIRAQLVPGNVVMTCHGFSFHYDYIQTPKGVDRLLVAPKGQGHMVRGEYLRGGGVPCLIAADDGATDETLPLGLAYAKALGGTKAGVIQTTIAAETETDLFGEQAVLCGGVSNLVKAGFDTLVHAGYQPELAYFECVHEMKIIVDLLHAKGLAAMREAISNTAEFGDYVSGPRVIDTAVRQKMKDILEDIQSGAFAKRFMDQHQDEDQELLSFRAAESGTEIEGVGQKLRAMMPWLETDDS
ncbi:MAG: ketol-acid reductoisomerase [Mariniblastus sp.]|nr:ketol-acid reductoisomerase [Mariniblastus sp.]